VFNVAPTLVPMRESPKHAAGLFLKRCTLCEGQGGLSYLPPGSPGTNGYIDRFNNRLRKGVAHSQPWNSVSKPGWLSALQIRAQQPPPAIRPWVTERRPSSGGVRQITPGALRDEPNPDPPPQRQDSTNRV